jgi:hypothetical protein
MQRVFAFGIALFANEHQRKRLYLLAISLLTFCWRRRLMTFTPHHYNLLNFDLPTLA